MKHLPEPFMRRVVDIIRSFMRILFLVFFTCTILLSNALSNDGEKLYKKCLGCHGKDAKHAPFERENGVLYGRDKEELKLIMQAIRDGHYKEDKLNKIMRKSIKNFSNSDIENIVQYIQTL